MEFSEVNPYLRSTGWLHWLYNDLDPSLSYDMRIFAIFKSEACLTLNGKQYNLREGSIVFLAPATPYHFRNRDDSAPFDLCCVSYDITQEYRYTASYIHPVYAPLFRPEYIIDRKIMTKERDLSNFGFPLILSDVPALCEAVKEIHSESTNKEPFYLERCSGLLKSALFSALRESEKIMSSADTPDAQLEYSTGFRTALTVIRYIEEYFHTHITEQSIAKELNFHPYYLARLTKRYFDTTPHRYLMECRINEAIRLMLTTDCTISEVAERSGFLNPSHFSTVFRKNVGMSPSEYRRNMKVMPETSSTGMLNTPS